MYSTPGGSFESTPRPITVQRRISFAGAARPAVCREDDAPLKALAELTVSKAEFFRFLDEQLEKIESFYKVQENEATERLEKLHEQLRIMGSSHVQEVIPSDTSLQKSQSRSDYSRRQSNGEVSPFTARRKLKIALSEYYHGLELLKSYALLNQIAFRKINKKYDNVINAKDSMQYMNEKVENAVFVSSNVIDEHVKLAEELYSEYFEGGNHKAAVGMLRKKALGHVDFTASLLRAGLFLGLGIALIMFGVASAITTIIVSSMSLTYLAITRTNPVPETRFSSRSHKAVTDSVLVADLRRLLQHFTSRRSLLCRPPDLLRSSSELPIHLRARPKARSGLATALRDTSSVQCPARNLYDSQFQLL